MPRQDGRSATTASAVGPSLFGCLALDGEGATGPDELCGVELIADLVPRAEQAASDDVVDPVAVQNVLDSSLRCHRLALRTDGDVTQREQRSDIAVVAGEGGQLTVEATEDRFVSGARVVRYEAGELLVAVRE